jgi:hypothetical protein
VNLAEVMDVWIIMDWRTAALSSLAHVSVNINGARAVTFLVCIVCGRGALGAGVRLGQGCAWGKGALGAGVRLGQGCAWGKGALGAGVRLGQGCACGRGALGAGVRLGQGCAWGRGALGARVRFSNLGRASFYSDKS